MEYLFVYGTLIQPSVQQQLFEHNVESVDAQLWGFTKGDIKIPDLPTGIIYPIISQTEEKTAKITGKVLKITSEELQIADTYEGPAYKRQKVKLVSGEEVWTYTSL